MEHQASIVPVTPATMSSRTKWAKPEDWEKFRNTITALWMLHSLPNLMRIMREEHDFHATPKMYQAQLYQKWGLRKGRPESKKKRRRQDSEDTESNASSSHRTFTSQPADSTVPAPNMVIPPQTSAPLQPAIAAIPVSTAAALTSSLPSHSGPTPIARQLAESLMLNDQEGINPAANAPITPIPPPTAWHDFITQSPSVITAPDPRTTTAPSVTMSQGTSEQFTLAGDLDLSGSWISTVLSTPPSVAPTARSRGSAKSYTSRSSAKSRASHVSSNSRASHASSSRETLLSSRSSGSRTGTRQSASIKSSMELPQASLRLLNSPTSLLLPEKSMFFARHYISSTFTTGLWTLSQSSDSSLLDAECIKLDQWYNDFNPGLEFLSSGRIKKAFRVFQPCFASTEQIIALQDPRVAIYICQQAIRFMYFDKLGRNLSRTLLDYAARVCKKLFGEQHPLCIFLAQLAKMDNFEFAKNIGVLMECYFDHIEPFLEQSSEAFGFLNELRGLTVSIMEGTGMMGIYEAKPILDRLIKRADEGGHSNLHLIIEQASILQRNRFFGEASRMLIQLRQSEEAVKQPYHFVYAGIVLMVTLIRNKDVEGFLTTGYDLLEFLANSMNRVESEFNTALYKSQVDSSIALVLGKLELTLRDHGRLEEADQVKTRLNKAMDAAYTAEGVEDSNMEPSMADNGLRISGGDEDNSD